MKKLIILSILVVVLMPLLGFFLPDVKAQTGFIKIDSTKSVGIKPYWFEPSSKLNIGMTKPTHLIVMTKPTHLIVIRSPSGKELNFDFAGDSLNCWGTLEPDSAATLFIKYVIEGYSTKIDSLKNEIKKLKGKK